MSAAAATTPAREAVAAAVDALVAAGVSEPRLDAELVLAEATGWDRARIAANPDQPLPPGASRKFAAMVRRRLRREPVAYILGRKGFRGIELAIDSRVLIPRPETELLVEVAVELEPANVTDIGTGSGALALAIADELPAATVMATDTSTGALEVAGANAERLGLAERVTLAEGTLTNRVAELLVANLPYVSEAEWEGLAPEIREHEPREALVAGPTGVEAIESILAEIARSATPPETIALEVGAGQSEAVAELTRSAGYGELDVRRDLAGIDRVVVGHR